VGRTMIDRDGKQLGEITDIYLDRETDRPEWGVVRTGLFGLRSSFVPLAKATGIEDDVQVPHPRTLVKDAPNIEADGQLSEAEEAELYRHYGLDYDSVAADSDQPADKRLVAQRSMTRLRGHCLAPTSQPVLRRPLRRSSGSTMTSRRPRVAKGHRGQPGRNRSRSAKA
jgi:hypothetical protein